MKYSQHLGAALDSCIIGLSTFGFLPMVLLEENLKPVPERPAIYTSGTRTRVIDQTPMIDQIPIISVITTGTHNKA